MTPTETSPEPRNVGRAVTYSVRTAEGFDIASRTTLELAGQWATRCNGSAVTRDDGYPLGPTECRRLAQILPD